MYLSKAFYKKKEFTNCQKITTKLMVAHPNDIRLKYNLAYCLYAQANETFNKNTRKVNETKYAIKQLN